jgi:tetratricopeptide (TPR) repeat protein
MDYDSEELANRMITHGIDSAKAYLKLGDFGGAVHSLRNTIAFVENHLVDVPACKRFYKSDDGERRQDWRIFSVRQKSTDIFVEHSTAASLECALHCAIQTRLELAKMLDVMSCYKEGHEISFYYYKCVVETQLGMIFCRKLQPEKSLEHYEEALKAARHRSFDRARLLVVLMNVSSAYSSMNHVEATKYSEEAYNLASEQHGPEHPDVQSAATSLVSTYLDEDRYFDAERFARINYECLADPNNVHYQNGALLVSGMIQLAKVWLLTPIEERVGGPEAAEEAEKLVRDAVCIIQKDESQTYSLMYAYATLAEILMARDQYTSEVEALVHKSLAVINANHGVGDPLTVQLSSCDRANLFQMLGKFYLDPSEKMSLGAERDVKLYMAKTAYMESIRLRHIHAKENYSCLVRAKETVARIETMLSRPSVI